MLLWPANSWLFWVAVAAGFALAMRFGLFPAQSAQVSRVRIGALLILAAGAVVAVIVLPMVALAAETDRAVGDALDYVLWTGAIFLGVLAILVATWALFADSSRGRKRCPACWYDMSASPTLTCPECGRTAAGPRALHRTRRRWRALPISAALLLLCGASAIGPTLRAGTAWDLVPDVVMVALSPYVSGWNRLEAVIDTRIGDIASDGRVGKPGSFRRKVMLRSGRAALHKSDLRTVKRGVQILQVAEREWGLHTDRLLELAEGPNVNLSQLAVWCLPLCAVVDERARDYVMGLLDSDDYTRFTVAVSFVLERAHYSPSAVVPPPEVEELGRHTNPRVRADVLTRVAYHAPSDPVTARLFEAALRDEDPLLRMTALRLVPFPIAPPGDLRQHVARGLADPAPTVRRFAAWLLVQMDYPDPDLWAPLPDILSTMAAADAERVISYVLHTTITEPKVRALLDAAERFPGLRGGVVLAFAHCREVPAPLVPLLREAAAAWRNSGDEPNSKALDDAVAAIENHIRMQRGEPRPAAEEPDQSGE